MSDDHNLFGKDRTEMVVFLMVMLLVLTLVVGSIAAMLNSAGGPDVVWKGINASWPQMWPIYALCAMPLIVAPLVVLIEKFAYDGTLRKPRPSVEKTTREKLPKAPAKEPSEIEAAYEVYPLLPESDSFPARRKHAEDENIYQKESLR